MTQPISTLGAAHLKTMMIRLDTFMNNTYGYKLILCWYQLYIICLRVLITTWWYQADTMWDFLKMVYESTQSTPLVLLVSLPSLKHCQACEWLSMIFMIYSKSIGFDQRLRIVDQIYVMWMVRYDCQNQHHNFWFWVKTDSYQIFIILIQVWFTW